LVLLIENKKKTFRGEKILACQQKREVKMSTKRKLKY